MREVRYSKSFNDQLIELIDFGEQMYGVELAEAKKRLVYETIERMLARHLRVKRPHNVLELTINPISKTPFIVLYDFDDDELRLHFIFHRNADLCDLDPASVEW